MSLVDTPTLDHSQFARNMDGSIDFDAYCGLSGSILHGELRIDVEVVDARQRYGHLDLLVTPIAGDGSRWVERKNVHLHLDPALREPRPRPLIEVLLEEPPSGKDVAVVETTVDRGVRSLFGAMTSRLASK